MNSCCADGQFAPLRGAFEHLDGMCSPWPADMVHEGLPQRRVALRLGEEIRIHATDAIVGQPGEDIVEQVSWLIRIPIRLRDNTIS
ncbi:hypothetical protein MDOR_22060 [Mycolicibacterium doricum]|uniref:Uncharacterized protein n=2 Tax=Mycolicibacterium doricum TaxID=126673 RepID=A0A7I7VT36_9MYCO|nr:hypothetical protein MDOR_22060 [Mycolicibacterium doricum]